MNCHDPTNGGVRAFQQQLAFKVVLLDDDVHSYEYVVRMLTDIFGYSPSRAYRMAVEVDTNGRVVVFRASLERAERARDLILGYGPDPRIPRSTTSMAAILEPA